MTRWISGAVDYKSSRSLARRSRILRWERLIDTFPSLSEMRVLDFGGTPESWELSPVMPKSLTTVNLQTHSDAPGITAVVGDACNPPPSLLKEQFDLVFSNSLLEHVGGHVQRQRLAHNIHLLSDRHWIQTPYRYFPVEPHFVFPGFQWLPYAARVGVAVRWHGGQPRRVTREQAQDSVDEIDLVGISQMHRYFPDSTIWYERFAGLIKSLVAIRK